MKKFGVFLLALSLMTIVHAQDKTEGKQSWTTTLAQKGILNHMDVGVNVGSLGIGLDVAVPVGDYVRVRAGYNYMPRFTLHSNFSIETRNGSISHLISKVGKISDKLAEFNIDLNKPGFEEYKELFDKFSNIEQRDYVTMGMSPTLHQFKFLVDIMPFKNNKHWSFTAGFFVGPSRIGKAYNMEKETILLEGINSYNDIYADYPQKGINGTYLFDASRTMPEGHHPAEYDLFYKNGLAGFNLGTFADGDKAMMVPDANNTIHADLIINKFRPYLGVGYNTHLSRNKKWNLNVDAGIMFLGGKPKILVNNVYKFDDSTLVLDENDSSVSGISDEDYYKDHNFYVSGIGVDTYGKYYGEIVRNYYDGVNEKYIDCSNIQNNVDLVRDLHDIPGKVGDMVNKISKFKVYPNISVSVSYRIF